MRLPDFIIGGAQKSGTTMLHSYLKAHPAVYFPAYPQELHYFDEDANYRKGLDWYANHFTAAKSAHTAVGQTSPLYIYEPATAERMAELLPQVKLIFILRHPVDRAYSHYWHEVKKGNEAEDFATAVALEPDRIQKDFFHRRHYSYVDRGRYATQLARYLRYYPAEQIKIVLNEQLRKQPTAVLDELCHFIGIEPLGPTLTRVQTNQNANAARLPRSQAVQRFTARFRYRIPRLVRLIDRVNLRRAQYPPLDPALAQRLADLYQPEIDQLQTMFPLDLTLWSRK